MRNNEVETYEWGCPKCKILNDIYLFPMEFLPDYLSCNGCEYKSGKMEWMVMNEN